MDLKKAGKSIGFVPTMGALHTGHLALLKRAKNECEIAVVSIFVNPLQFNDKKDLERYPRTLEKDSEMLSKAGCDVLFAPSAEEMYPSQQPEARLALSRVEVSQEPATFIDLGDLDKIMEGAHRPGHFQGVCVVVKKLFDIVEPNKAYFGEKDFQQLAVIRHMVKQLNMPVNIIPCPTVREEDGLAMSSRNSLLSSEERAQAPAIHASLLKAKEYWKGGRVEGMTSVSHSSIPIFQPSIADLKKSVGQMINANACLKLEYFEIVNAESLDPITKNPSQGVSLRACIAVKAGNVRLIDNIAF